MTSARVDTPLLPDHLVTPDGETLHIRHWPTPEPRGIVHTLHGFGEHQGCFAHIARALNDAGWSVAGIDQRGHGRSSSAPGVIGDPEQLLAEQGQFCDVLRQHYPGIPYVMLGASMGGLFASRFAAAQASEADQRSWARPADAIVLISPALSPELPPPQRATLSVLSRLVPDLPVKLDHLQRWGSTDLQALAEKLADPLIHTRLTPRMALFLLRTAKELQPLLPQWRTPTFLACARQDRVVPYAACEHFMRHVPAQWLATRIYDDMAHDLLHEPCRDTLAAEIVSWLDQRR